MSEPTNFLAVDLGASSGRVMLGGWDRAHFALRELHRFPNDPVRVQGHLYWDVLRLWQEIQAGMARYAAEYAAPPAGIGIDAWAIDFGLLNGGGRLPGHPHHFRDRRPTGIAKAVDARIAPDQLYSTTGIQRLPFNTRP